MNGHDIIVIGASLGGVEVLKSLIPQIPEDLPAAVFIVIHTAAHGPFLLHEILSRTALLPIRVARDLDDIRPGTIYLAPPNTHLLITRERMRITDGPLENGVRPAIDPLFRSAAVAFTSRVIGVILSDLPDDGTAGLSAIKRCGGLTMDYIS